MSDHGWISAHIFSQGDLNQVLLRGVSPLLQKLQAQALIERFFFIRYWQGGPHIRLRLLPAAGCEPAQITTPLEQHIAAFFAAYPSADTLDPAQYAATTEYLSLLEYGEDQRVPLYPNNSLQYLPYQPEYGRYGGREAMLIVEQFFMESSQLALHLLAGGMTRNQCTGQALASMLLAAAPYADQRADLAQIFALNYRAWNRVLGAQPAQAEARFERQYQQQRQQLHQLVARLLALAWQPDSAPDDPLIARWLDTNRELKCQLDRLEQRGVLVVEQPGRLFSGPLSIILSCLHMHNNRLGATLVEEAYILFLLKRALADLGDSVAGSALVTPTGSTTYG